ncbi:MAG: 50S ribosomal protein L15 [Bifidobacteriaceae bacterium]|jgi:large subunit ribosomal protein L15|nr:50S ribosomal protein L15 [Bifidobacteriaceae bacterium]
MVEKKSAVKKDLAKKSPVKKVVTKKAAPKKEVAKKTVAKKVAPKKVAPKKAAPKKEVAKKIAPKKEVAKTKKEVAKKAAPKKTAPKKTISKKESQEKVRLLKIHHLKPALGAKHKKQRVGRGDGSKGKTAGRGTKGTKARNTVYAGFEGGQMPLHMRIPKFRGFKNPAKIYYQVVNLSALEKGFPNGGKIAVDDLVAKGLVRKNKLVKILGSGEISAKIDIKVNKASATAKTKIEKAGGSIELLGN